jgi:uncharacterized HAD superfamily protein
MDERISDLLGIIKEEINLYREFIEHSREKTALLAQGRVEAILESNKVEETFSIKLRFLENELSRLCSDICRTLGIGYEEFTLIKLAEKLEQSAAVEIKLQAALFKNVVMQLKSVTDRNLRLIKKSLRYSQGLLGLISNATSPYQQTGLFRPIPSIQPTFSRRA